MLKLGEAVLLGSSKIGEAREYFLSADKSCGCAIGAAVVATGSHVSGDDFLGWTMRTWPWTRSALTWSRQ
jgi:hypothetical protein